MAVYPIVTVPNDVLVTPAKPVNRVTPHVCRVLDNLRETMKLAGGIGLAAPQVNISKRLAVVDPDDGLGTWELINPELLEGRDERIGPDACLSIPGITGETLRYEWVRIRTWTRGEEWVELEAKGLRARCIQHEMDHLDGILFTMKAVRLHAVADKGRGKAGRNRPSALVLPRSLSVNPEDSGNPGPP
ncbi:MAG: peptide deformylase [Alicyclobacillus sp.]|nr:peptide deformylase [Alicyclobacillus sp.]